MRAITWKVNSLIRIMAMQLFKNPVRISSRYVGKTVAGMKVKNERMDEKC